MGFLDIFFKKSKRKNYKVTITAVDHSGTTYNDAYADAKRNYNNSIPSYNGLKPPEILMISLSTSYNNTTVNFPGYWRYTYGIDNPRATLEMLKSRGFIKDGSPSSALAQLKVPELKEMLVEIGQPTSGKKADLIERIKSNASDEFIMSKVSFVPYEITELGQKEIKDNEYVLYFHKHKGAYGMNVWDINKSLENYPHRLWRDRIWGKLNQDYEDCLEKYGMGDFSDYSRVRFTMCDFLYEEKREPSAIIRMWIEGAYLDINYVCRDQYKQAVYMYNFIKQSNPSADIEEPDISTCYSFNRSIDGLKWAKDELSMSDDELKRRIIDHFQSQPFPPTMSTKEALDLINRFIALN